MEIRITKDLRAFEFDAGLNSGMFYSKEVTAALRKNAGKWFEVDDRHLFKDQYILKPNQALSDFRITDLMVSEVSGDVRVGINYCFNCGAINMSGMTCKRHVECERLGVFNFNEKNTYFLKKHRIIRPRKQITPGAGIRVTSSFSIETFEDMFILRSKFEGIVIFKVTAKYFLIRSGFTWLQSEKVPDKVINGLPEIRSFLKCKELI